MADEAKRTVLSTIILPRRLLTVLAQVVATKLAVAAVGAVDAGLDSDTVADLEVSGIVTDSSLQVSKVHSVKYCYSQQHHRSRDPRP